MRGHLFGGVLSLSMVLLAIARPDSAWAGALATTGFESASGFLPCGCSGNDQADNQPISSLSDNGVVSVQNQSSFNTGQHVIPDGNSYSASSEISSGDILLDAAAKGGGGAGAGAGYSSYITVSSHPNTVTFGRAFDFSIGNQTFSYLEGMKVAGIGKWRFDVAMPNSDQSNASGTTTFTTSVAQYPNADLTTGNLGPPFGNAAVIGSCGYSGSRAGSGAPTNSFNRIGQANVDGLCGVAGGSADLELFIPLTQDQAKNLLENEPLVFGLNASANVRVDGGFIPGNPSSVSIPSSIAIDETHSLDITGFELLDSNGLVVPGFDFTSVDGFNFAVSPGGTNPGGLPGGSGDHEGTSLPEPSSVLLLSAGLLGLAGVRRAHCNP